MLRNGSKATEILKELVAVLTEADIFSEKQSKYLLDWWDDANKNNDTLQLRGIATYVIYAFSMDRWFRTELVKAIGNLDEKRLTYLQNLEARIVDLRQIVKGWDMRGDFLDFNKRLNKLGKIESNHNRWKKIKRFMNKLKENP